MKLLNKIICIVFFMCIINSQVYALDSSAVDIQKNIENKYGVNVIVSDNINENDLIESFKILECSLEKFSEGIIKEITDYYLIKGIETNIIIKEKENIIDLNANYKLTDNSINLYINILTNNFFGKTYSTSSDGIVHELGHFIGDYLIEIYSYDKLKSDFELLNNGYEYGKWGKDYNKVFVNKNSASSLYDDIADLIWYVEVKPDDLRNVNYGKKEIIHKKVVYLANLFDESFDSIKEDTKLWLEAVPTTPDKWALETISVMTEEGLIPEDFDGKYGAYVTKEDFYILIIKLAKEKLGEEDFYNSFDMVKPEKGIKLNPINGEIVIEDKVDKIYNINSSKYEEYIYDAYKFGLIQEDDDLNLGTPITRLEASKLLVLMIDKLGIDISNYEEVEFSDIKDISDIDKPYLYFAVNKEIIKGDGNKLMPYEYCTYQEVYIMLDRVCDIL